MMQLAADVGSVPEQVGAVIVLDAGDDFDAQRAALTVAGRLGKVPRLRQVLTPAGIGRGRPIWVDDPSFDPNRHVGVVACARPGDETALLSEAGRLITQRLARGSPPWRAAVVTGLTDRRAAIVFAFHHVLADGVGGLAVLQQLVDRGGAVGPPAPRDRLASQFPRPAPSGWQLAVDAWATRVRAGSRVAVAVRTLARDVVAAHRTGLPRASPSSLNRPTGQQRRSVVVRAGLAPLRAVAHDNGATINDVVLASVAGALRELVVRRGEPVPALVASVPVARRTTTTAADLGNRLGGMLVRLPLSLDHAERLHLTAAETRTRKDTPGDLLVGPVFRAMSALRLTRWFVSHQRMVTTFITDLRGPASPLTFLGRTVLEILPISHLTGNVTTTFAAMSYDGTLAITVTADPDACPDLDDLAELLQAELDAMADLPGAGAFPTVG